MQFITDDDYNLYSVFALMMSMAENVISCMYTYVPYVWYIWRTLSLAIWEEKQIGRCVAWQISSNHWTWWLLLS